MVGRVDEGNVSNLHHIAPQPHLPNGLLDFATPRSHLSFSHSMIRSVRHLTLFAYFALASAVLACSVPVFRYALEHWPADPFQLTLFHRGPLSPAQQEAITKAQPKEGHRANILIRLVDLDANPPADLQRLFDQQKNAQPPWIVARFPSPSGVPQPVLSFAFTPESLAAALDSPTRQSIVQRLAEGESAVWLLLDSGDTDADTAAEKLLQERLDYLTSVMTLPLLDESDIANGLVSVPEEDLRLDFSILRLSRTDPAEQALVQMLLQSEPGLSEESDPMVFPIFGQGRALYALVGEGIRHETIEAAAAFLVGKCSCQVKEQNPGVDLLMTADWAAAGKASPLLDRNLPTLSEILPSEPETLTTRSTSTVTHPSNDRAPWLYGIAIIVIALAAFRLLFKR